MVSKMITSVLVSSMMIPTTMAMAMPVMKLPVKALNQTMETQVEEKLCNWWSSTGSLSSNKKAWDTSIAGPIGDEYLNEHGSRNWLPKLWEELFPDNPSTSYNCLDEGDTCNVEGVCSKSK
jgi:hypothetical protein